MNSIQKKDCKHVWVANSGKGGEPDYRLNRHMWAGLRMHVCCSECNDRTWMSKEEWENIPEENSK